MIQVRPIKQSPRYNIKNLHTPMSTFQISSYSKPDHLSYSFLTTFRYEFQSIIMRWIAGHLGPRTIPYRAFETSLYTLPSIQDLALFLVEHLGPRNIPYRAFKTELYSLSSIRDLTISHYTKHILVIHSVSILPFQKIITLCTTQVLYINRLFMFLVSISWYTISHHISHNCHNFLINVSQFDCPLLRTSP